MADTKTFTLVFSGSEKIIEQTENDNKTKYRTYIEGKLQNLSTDDNNYLDLYSDTSNLNFYRILPTTDENLLVTLNSTEIESNSTTTTLYTKDEISETREEELDNYDKDDIVEKTETITETDENGVVTIKTITSGQLETEIEYQEQEQTTREINHYYTITTTYYTLLLSDGSDETPPSIISEDKVEIDDPPTDENGNIVSDTTISVVRKDENYDEETGVTTTKVVYEKIQTGVVEVETELYTPDAIEIIHKHYYTTTVTETQTPIKETVTQGASIELNLNFIGEKIITKDENEKITDEKTLITLNNQIEIDNEDGTKSTATTSEYYQSAFFVYKAEDLSALSDSPLKIETEIVETEEKNGITVPKTISVKITVDEKLLITSGGTAMEYTAEEPTLPSDSEDPEAPSAPEVASDNFGSGMRIDVKNGQIISYGNFLVRAREATSEATTTITISTKGSTYKPYFEVTKTRYEHINDSSEGTVTKAFIHISSDQYYLQSYDYNQTEKTGLMINLYNGYIHGYNFKLKAENSAGGSVLLTSDANDTPLQVNGPNGKFYVTWNGILNAEGANISGVLHAGGGSTIGGWTIGDYKIYVADLSGGSVVMQVPHIITTGQYAGQWSTWVFAAGGSSNDSYGDCPFRVDREGKLYTEKLKATGGTIGNWTINGSSLSGGTLEAGTIKAGTISGGTISAATIKSGGSGSINFGDNFKVASDGTVTIKGSLKIGGKITFSGDAAIYDGDGDQILSSDNLNVLYAKCSTLNVSQGITVGTSNIGKKDWSKLASFVDYLNDSGKLKSKGLA